MNSTYTKVDLHKQLKASRKVIKKLAQEKDRMKSKKGFNYGKWANRFVIISMALGLSLAFGMWG